MTNKPKRVEDPQGEDHRKERKTIWLPLSESTPVKLGLVLVLLGAVGTAVYWAATMEAQAGSMKDDVKETKKIFEKMSSDVTAGMKEVTMELKSTTETLKDLMYAQALISKGNQIQLKSLEHRCDRIEMRQIKMLEDKDP